MTCLDCKATPGGICAPHKLATSFDAPTEEEATIERLRQQNSILREELAEQMTLVRNAGRPHFRYLRNGMVSC